MLQANTSVCFCILTFHFYDGFALGILTFYTCSKRISGFDMAPPASAMLAGAASAGTFVNG